MYKTWPDYNGVHPFQCTLTPDILGYTCLIPMQNAYHQQNSSIGIPTAILLLVPFQHTATEEKAAVATVYSRIALIQTDRGYRSCLDSYASVATNSS